MTACCRAETNFHDDRKEDEKADDGNIMTSVAEDQRKAVLDLAREVGVMLLLAQERAREGKDPARPGEGKWWTVTPRWGGGPGGLMEDEVLPEQQLNEDKEGSTSPPRANEAMQEPSTKPTNPPNPPTTPLQEDLQHSSARPKRKANAEDATAPPASNSNSSSSTNTKKSVPHKRNSSSKPTLAQKWKTLRPGPSIWDPRMRYMRIGKPTPPLNPPSTTAADTGAGSGSSSATAANGDEDTIITLSGINHHVALLGMHVSDRYLAWLAGEEVESETHQTAHAQVEALSDAQAAGVDGLVLRRTRWFDLFDEGDRVEFVEGLWGVMAWLMRDG
jgi:type IV secretory pathway VirB10-like protein